MQTIAPIFIFGLPVLLVLAVALVGSTRRLGFWLSLIASILLTPIGGMILAVISGSKRPPKRAKPKPPEPTSEGMHPSVPEQSA